MRRQNPKDKKSQKEDKVEPAKEKTSKKDVKEDSVKGKKLRKDAKAGPVEETRKRISREELIEGWTPRERPEPDEEYTFNRLEQFDYIREMTKKNIWYYRDRLSVPRGPCPLPVLRECWVNGVIDENTLIWGQGLIDWLPAKNIRTLICQIRTPEVQLATWLKKNLSLKPAIARQRRLNPKSRSVHCDQVDDMY